MVSIHDQPKVLHGLFKEPIAGSLKFKMADGRHTKNRFLAMTQYSRLSDFTEILHKEA